MKTASPLPSGRQTFTDGVMFRLRHKSALRRLSGRLEKFGLQRDYYAPELEAP
ncbi:hypothetical protein SKAU_G00005570 [Synaphobranchus kaupii]|uniref:Uncharacterized protein n=1 Tax=Synaphobranchus kaupii TaxID=118154 RepID=A0A9Q1GA75_SYNKA|nr:hypothetical protein SKAU_G00005570 [Synaphobranchus kaupii]